MNKHRTIWINSNGEIPCDEFGRSYEIHHRDGNRANNDLTNLMCISIKDHYDIHYTQGDWGACVMIAKRMQLDPDEVRSIQTGKKRPGVGGVPKGTIPWSKGRRFKPNISAQGKQNKIEANKARALIDDDTAALLRKMYHERILINDERIGKTQRNGRIFSYRRAFAEYFASIYGVTVQYIDRIIAGKAKVC